MVLPGESLQVLAVKQEGEAVRKSASLYMEGQFSDHNGGDERHHSNHPGRGGPPHNDEGLQASPAQHLSQAGGH